MSLADRRASLQRLREPALRVDRFADPLVEGNGGALSFGLQSGDALYAFAMIARQVRLLILVRDCLDRGVDPAKSLGRVAFLARRLSTQANNFSLLDLKDLYQILFEIDINVKRGKIALEPSLDNLIASLSTADSIRQLEW